MKKTVVVLLVLIAIVGGAFALWRTAECRPYDVSADLVRIHIRANSNDEEDQRVKLLVRDSITEFLIPVLAETTNKAEALAKLTSLIAELTRVADTVLVAQGFSYKSSARVCEEAFPARQYGDLVLDAGVYDALIINLGAGVGNNWWCVAYPPLCFVPSTDCGNVVYKSKIKEIISKWKNK